MSPSKIISIIFSFFIVMFQNVIVQCKSVNENNELPISSFGLDFFYKYNSLKENETFYILPNCSMQLQLLVNSIKKQELWALQFADSWGKAPAGIFYGNKVDMGNFDECLSINKHFKESSVIKGKYCLSSLNLQKNHNDTTPDFLKSIQFTFGICIPTVCNANYEVQSLLNKYIERYWNTTTYHSSVRLAEQKCTTKERGSFEVLDWVAIGVLILLGALLILSTSYEYITKKNEKSLNPLWTAFSIPKNMSQLMRLTSNKETPRHIIPALNGIRCLSLVLVIFFHTYIELIISPNVNKAEYFVFEKTIFYMFFRNSQYAVDTFFFLSGLLLASVAFREMEKSSGKLNIPRFYLHRFIRLSPILYMAVLLFMTLYRFSGNGPLWNSFSYRYEICGETWWATLLYVQNYAYAASNKTCMEHSWYLAADTQLYLISPIVLILIWRWRKWGLAILTSFGLLPVAYLFIMIIIKDIIVFERLFTKHSLLSEDFISKAYYFTHFRLSPWIIGIIFGYYLHFHKDRRIVLPKLLVILGWLISMVLFTTVVLVLYPRVQPDAKELTPLEGAFYLPLSHIAWPLGLCWIVFACLNGYGGPINEILSWVIWQPLSKLSYSMYVWHILIIYMNFNQMKTNSHLSNYDEFLFFCGVFGITLIASTIMYLAIEAPMQEIEKYLTSKKIRPKEDKQCMTKITEKIFVAT